MSTELKLRCLRCGRPWIAFAAQVAHVKTLCPYCGNGHLRADGNGREA